MENEESSWRNIKLQNIFHEFLAMFLFVFICCGSVALSGDLDVLAIATIFGICITVLVYSIAHTSGGQVNSAVTVALMVSGDLDVVQGLCNIVAQILGAICGAFLLSCVANSDSSLGANQMPATTTVPAACIAEFMGTYLLCWVVFQTAVAEKSITRGKSDFNPVTAPIAIGAAVFLAHTLLIKLTSCSINFPRTLGPAIILQMKSGIFNGDGGSHFWVYCLMPHLAGICAGAQRRLTVSMLSQKKEMNLFESPNLSIL